MVRLDAGNPAHAWPSVYIGPNRSQNVVDAIDYVCERYSTFRVKVLPTESFGTWLALDNVLTDHPGGTVCLPEPLLWSCYAPIFPSECFDDPSLLPVPVVP